MITLAKAPRMAREVNEEQEAIQESEWVHTFTKQEDDKIDTFAKNVRAAHSWKNNVKEDNWKMGLKGEIVYGKLTNQPVNYTVYEGARGDGGIDFEDGAQVKTVSFLGYNRQLKVSPKSLSTPGLKKFVLCGYNKHANTVEAIGEISLENFKKKAQLSDYYGSDILILSEYILDKHYKKNNE